MSEIKALLASLDEMRGKATQGEWEQIFYRDGGIEICSINGALTEQENDYLISLHNNYPTLRAHIEKLSREAVGLADALELILPLAKGYAYALQVGSNGRYVDTAKNVLNAYRTATQDLTSGETVKCSIKVEDFASLLQPGRIEAAGDLKSKEE